MADDPRLILHVGAPKCGSSALQRALSETPEFTSRGGRRFSYVAVERGGRIWSGADLTRAARSNAFGAKSSSNVVTPEEAETNFGAAPARFDALRQDGTCLILSNEGWASRASNFAESRIIERLGGGALVVLYVRPPVDWMNSAWWQWGVWTGRPIERYVARNRTSAQWNRLAREWEKVPGVDKVVVELATDVVGRFFRLLDCDAPDETRANSGVPTAFLLFLLRNRTYRPDAHSSRVEFAVAQRLPQRHYPAPWALDATHVEQVFQVTRRVGEGLGNRLDARDRAALDADPRWWSPEAYAGRTPEDLSAHETVEALSDLAGMMAEGLGADRTEAHAEMRSRLDGLDRARRLDVADAAIAALVDRMLAPMEQPARKRPMRDLLMRMHPTRD